MAEGELRVCDAYAYTLLKKWERVIELREEFIMNYMNNRANPVVANEYISRLVSLWAELLPKVSGRTDHSEIAKTFEALRPYRYDPRTIYKNDDPTVLMQLDEAIRMVIETLGITKFEVG